MIIIIYHKHFLTLNTHKRSWWRKTRLLLLVFWRISPNK